MIAWRGVVLETGEIAAWPTALMDHSEAFNRLPALENYVCQWRQWGVGGEVDFDPGCSDYLKARVRQWVHEATS